MSDPISLSTLNSAVLAQFAQMTVVTVYISDAPDIYSHGFTDSNSYIQDNFGNVLKGGQITQLDSPVFQDSRVIWFGLIEPNERNAGYSLTMDYVLMDPTGDPSKSKVFKRRLLPGEGTPDIIIAQTRKQFLPGFVNEKYEVSLTLTRPDGETRFLPIDPVLKGNASRYIFSYLRVLINTLALPDEFVTAVSKLIDDFDDK